VGSTPHNQRAKVLRNGLIVCLFNMLEQFLKERFGELAKTLSGTAIPYSDFPDSLKLLFSIRAIDGLRGFLRFSDRSLRLSLFDAYISPIGGMNSAPPNFSHFGFGHERSNINDGEVASTLSAFGVEECWKLMGAIAARTGIARASLKDDFQLIGSLRNAAAHSPTANITTSDLEMAASIVTATAIGFDLVATAAVQSYCSLPSASKIKQAVKSPSIRLRFLDHVRDNTWREKGEAAKRYLRTHPNLVTAKAMASGRPGASRETIVVRSASLIPVEWLN
jgi:hypothetical protein